jgi:hypothetical protein
MCQDIGDTKRGSLLVYKARYLVEAHLLEGRSASERGASVG